MQKQAKSCTKCGETKPLSEFSPRGPKKPGQHHSRCKACSREDWAGRSEQRKAYRAANRDRERATWQAWLEIPGNRERVAKSQRESNRRLRELVIEAYGGKCVCCGEAEYVFLTIDHINNDGNVHRKTVSPAKLPRWLIANDFPDDFQILCWNCNAAKAFHGVCPHQRDSLAISA